MNTAFSCISLRCISEMVAGRAALKRVTISAAAAASSAETKWLAAAAAAGGSAGGSTAGAEGVDAIAILPRPLVTKATSASLTSTTPSPFPSPLRPGLPLAGLPLAGVPLGLSLCDTSLAEVAPGDAGLASGGAAALLVSRVSPLTTLSPSRPIRPISPKDAGANSMLIDLSAATSAPHLAASCSASTGGSSFSIESRERPRERESSER